MNLVAVLAVHAQASSAQRRYIVQIRPALPCATLVCGLVLDGDWRARPAAPFGSEVKAAPGASNALLDISAPMWTKPLSIGCTGTDAPFATLS
jgi:hypothetical protein